MEQFLMYITRSVCTHNVNLESIVCGAKNVNSKFRGPKITSIWESNNELPGSPVDLFSCFHSIEKSQPADKNILFSEEVCMFITRLSRNLIIWKSLKIIENC